LIKLNKLKILKYLKWVITKIKAGAVVTLTPLKMTLSSTLIHILMQHPVVEALDLAKGKQLQ
jgi:hypothetical protein